MSEELISEEERQKQAAGIKEEAGSDELVGVAKDDAVDGEVFPSFFIEDDERHRVEVDVLYNSTTGALVKVFRRGVADLDAFTVLRHTTEWFDFSIPDYDQVSRYRQECAFYNRQLDRMIVDDIQLKHFLWVHHLKDWSLRGSDGEKVELEFEKSGGLTEGCVSGVVYRVPVGILDVVMTMFVKDRMIL